MRLRAQEKKKNCCRPRARPAFHAATRASPLRHNGLRDCRRAGSPVGHCTTKDSGTTAKGGAAGLQTMRCVLARERGPALCLRFARAVRESSIFTSTPNAWIQTGQEHTNASCSGIHACPNKRKCCEQRKPSCTILTFLFPILFGRSSRFFTECLSRTLKRAQPPRGWPTRE